MAKVNSPRHRWQPSNGRSQTAYFLRIGMVVFLRMERQEQGRSLPINVYIFKGLDLSEPVTSNLWKLYIGTGEVHNSK